MNRRQLAVALRIRQLAVRAAAQNLIAAVAADNAAQLAVTTATSVLRHEAAIAADISCDDTVAEAFARWLPRGQESLRQAQRDQLRSAAAADHARALLAAARSAEAAVKALIAAQDEKVTISSQNADRADGDVCTSRRYSAWPGPSESLDP